MTYMPGQVMAVVAAVLILCCVGFALWKLIEKNKQGESPELDAPFMRGWSIVNHLEYGRLMVNHYDPETKTSGVWTGVDSSGNVYTFPAHFEDFKMRNVAQCLLGEHPEYDMIPHDRAKETAAAFAADVADSGRAVHYKRQAQEATTAQKLAETGVELKLEKAVARMEKLQRGGGQQQPMPRRSA